MKSRPLAIPDVLLLSLCGLMVASLCFAQIQRRRTAARSRQCSNNLKQLGLAFHNYHAAYRQLPIGSGGTGFGSAAAPLRGNANRLSAIVGLTPFIEEQRIWELISNPQQYGKTKFPPMGPVPWYPADQYAPWSMRSTVLACPTDPDTTKFPNASSYVLNYGDAVVSVGAPIESEFPPYVIDRASKRGLFIRQKGLRFRDVLDGLSNTLILSESKVGGARVAKGVEHLGLNPSLCKVAIDRPGQAFWPLGRNACWADGSLLSSGFQTILPPNSPSATSNVGELEGVMSVSSNHAGGVHVLFVDGAVKFASDSIDTGDTRSPSVATLRGGNRYAYPEAPSPYGLWGALGTRASRETVLSENDGIDEPPREINEQERRTLQSLPMETWTKDDGTVFRGQFMEIRSDSQAIILTEAGDSVAIKLSDLKSEDAYRAVQNHLQAEIQANQEILLLLEKSVAMLEKKEFEHYVALTYPDQIPNATTGFMIDQVRENRGMMIQQFDNAIRDLKKGTTNVRRESQDGAMAVQTKFGTLYFYQKDDRWIFGRPVR